MLDPGEKTARFEVSFRGQTSSASRSLPPSSLGKRPRPSSRPSRSHLNDSESESDPKSDDFKAPLGKHEAVAAFGSYGAEIAEDTEQPANDVKRKILVIERLGNRGWIEAVKARRKKDTRREDEPTAEAVAQEPQPIQQWGLVVTESSSSRTQEDHGTEKLDSDPTPNPLVEADPSGTDPDREALNALLGRPTVPTESSIPVSEKDALRTSVADAADVSTLEEYDRMPVEEFGAALLRGMGWNGDPSSKSHEVKRRPNGLGLGAKALSDEAGLDLQGMKRKVPNGSKNGRPRLQEYRREETRRKAQNYERVESYKRDRERDGERDRSRHPSEPYKQTGRPRSRSRDRHRHRENGTDRHRGVDCSHDSSHR